MALWRRAGSRLPGLLLLLTAAVRGVGGRPAPDKAEIVAACFFAYALKLDMPGSNHHTIRGADFQRRAWDFYAGLPAPAPLEEAMWMLMLPESFQEVVAKECPAMLILAYMLVAETKLYIDPGTAREYAEIASSLYQRQEPKLRALIAESWPVGQATERFNSASQAALAAAERTSSAAASFGGLDFVLAHCREDLGWVLKALRHWALPGRSRLFVYEKCGQRSDDLRPLDAEGGLVPVRIVTVDDGSGGRKDECSAYLTHLLNVAQTADPAYYTVFLQGDAFQHVQVEFFDLIMRALRHGTLDVPFLHLGRARMVASASPCKRAIYEQVMGRPPQAMQVSYCCAHFLVRRDMVLARGTDGWQRTLDAMDELPSSGCEGVRAGAGMHCLVFEAMWHVMFGVQDQLTPRSMDTSLPVFLRVPEVDGTDLPAGANSSMYFAQAHGDPDAAAWMADLQVEPVQDVTGARSIGYLAYEGG
eukprot:TRINITY_DN38713_c0_g1_i1.p1 TRINITY_DN38713_c0_g1~~TRINITY_DN38713_c0_g1_i1.p1  ORF type:complete len:475 (+),score=86.01 TRINITY_DN38713_c0_g1_i1:102-1526(+)